MFILTLLFNELVTTLNIALAKTSAKTYTNCIETCFTHVSPGSINCFSIIHYVTNLRMTYVTCFRRINIGNIFHVTPHYDQSQFSS